MFLYLTLLVWALVYASDGNTKTIKIAVIDTGINHIESHVKICPNGLYDMTGNIFHMNVQSFEMTDEVTHGTNISYIIADNLKDVDYCMYIIKVYGKTSSFNAYTHLLGFLLAYNLDVDVVNYSSGGLSNLHEEEMIIKFMTDRGTTFVTAAGNESKNLDLNCNFFPCCYKETVCVGNMYDKYHKHYLSNYGSKVTKWELGCNIDAGGVVMTGSSQSTALYTAKLVRELAGKK